jgi:hypothetical protein
MPNERQLSTISVSKAVRQLRFGFARMFGIRAAQPGTSEADITS